MPKTLTALYRCTKCDAQHPKWLGRCSTCGGWGTIVQSDAISQRTAQLPRIDAQSIPTLAAMSGAAVNRLPTGISEFDFAIGGGLVPSSALLLSGEPGIGKSTLVLQIAAAVANHPPPHLPLSTGEGEKGGGEVLYVTGEETAAQIRSRADRTGLDAGRVRLLATNDGGAAAAAINTLRPALAIVDSVQTLTLSDIPPDAGGITQVRALTGLLVNTAKTTGVPVAIIGHVTKDGAIAGPKSLEHLVDQVAVLEGDPTSDLRVLRTTKNRYGPTDVVGVFTMTERGLQPCPDPSAAFLSGHRGTPNAGNAVAAAIQGNRVLLVEIQTLITRSAFGMPQRRTLGIDINRLHVLLAVLARHGGISLASSDVHAVTVGGFRLDDPASDLALLAALSSAAVDAPLPFDACIGAVGLDGSIRSVRALERRAQEAARLGRTRLAVPAGIPDIRRATLTPLPTVRELVNTIAKK